MSKKLTINAAVCDLRGITEEKAKAYDEININGACIVTSPEAKRALLATTVNMNAAQTIDIPGEIKLIMKNGSFTIKKDSASCSDVFLIVNGSLEIEPDSVDVVKSYYGITVNGKVNCPESASQALSAITVNGPSCFYPDHKILFDGVADAVFLARLVNGNEYFTRNTVYLLDPMLDYSPLEGVSIEASAACVYEGFISKAARIFTGNTPIKTVPDGTVVLKDCPRLTAEIVSEHGPKLFVHSDLEIIDGKTLNRIQFLKISGTAYVKEELLPLPECVKVQSVVPYRPLMIRGLPSADIDQCLLESEEQGVLVADCASVNLSGDIPPALIRDRLLIYDCGVVRCSAQQRGAVNTVAHDIAVVTTPEESSPDGEDPQSGSLEKINSALFTF